MNEWLEPKRILSIALNATGLVIIFFAVYGTFNAYADGWGKQIAVAIAAAFVFGASYVKKLPI